MCTFWNRSIVLLALLAAPAMASATPLESGFERGAFSAAGSFRAVASAGAALGRRTGSMHEPQGGAMLAASLGLLGLIAVRRLRVLLAL